jgi:hypothetical protein
MKGKRRWLIKCGEKTKLEISNIQSRQRFYESIGEHIHGGDGVDKRCLGIITQPHLSDYYEAGDKKLRKKWRECDWD